MDWRVMVREEMGRRGWRYADLAREVGADSADEEVCEARADAGAGRRATGRGAIRPREAAGVARKNWGHEFSELPPKPIDTVPTVCYK